MKIFLMGEMAFIDISKGFMLCIGSKDEAMEASAERLIEMINEAIAWSKYREIENTLHTRH